MYFMVSIWRTKSRPTLLCTGNVKETPCINMKSNELCCWMLEKESKYFYSSFLSVYLKKNILNFEQYIKIQSLKTQQTRSLSQVRILTKTWKFWISPVIIDWIPVFSAELLTTVNTKITPVHHSWVKHTHQQLLKISLQNLC